MNTPLEGGGSTHWGNDLLFRLALQHSSENAVEVPDKLSINDIVLDPDL